jgi:RNA polymerase sigma-70 factor (ECF subfamily)
MGFVRDRAQAQDLVQDIFTKLFFQLSKFHGKSRFSTWLYAVTYNHCIEHLRKNNRFQTVDIEEEADIREELSETELLATQQDLLRKALDQVGPEDRMVLLMKYQDDMSVQEIMEILAVGESAVKMRLARARQRVKAILETKAEFYA